MDPQRATRLSMTTASCPRLVGRGISVSHPGRDVLMGVSIEVAVGDRVALIGPSGSGKTTLLSVLGGLLRPHQGEVFADVAGERRSPDGEVGWVLQTTNGLGRRTVLDNVLLGTLRQRDPIATRLERCDRALEAVGLLTSRGRAVRTLSGGELQRVSIARAIAACRPFILADEPTGQLDRASTTTVLDAMFSVDTDRAVVVATHDPQVWERCGRVYHLENGRIFENPGLA